MISEIETAIVNRLNSQITTIKAVATPDEPDGFKELPSKVSNGLIVVTYKGTTFETLTQGASDQERTIQFAVFLLYKTLRDHSGSYALLKSIRTALNGYAVWSTIPLECVEERFLAHTPDLWLWGMTFQIEVLNEE
ncbi:MAG: hypothetical protein HQM08_17410 [Candidatus Riflebacteria bacterium]|nr:hypothetical protein [Candidatus Riflebacteria bacterium]